MITKNQIKSVLSDYIIKDCSKRFVIYPFGENGMNVKDVLYDCFFISPYMVVDNNLSKYNDRIIDSEQLYRVIEDSVTIIFTIEDAYLHGKLLNELMTYVDEKQIIDLPTLINLKF